MATMNERVRALIVECVAESTFDSLPYTPFFDPYEPYLTEMQRRRLTVALELAASEVVEEHEEKHGKHMPAILAFAADGRFASLSSEWSRVSRELVRVVARRYPEVTPNMLNEIRTNVQALSWERVRECVDAWEAPPSEWFPSWNECMSHERPELLESRLLGLPDPRARNVHVPPAPQPPPTVPLERVVQWARDLVSWRNETRSTLVAQVNHDQAMAVIRGHDQRLHEPIAVDALLAFFDSILRRPVPEEEKAGGEDALTTILKDAGGDGERTTMARALAYLMPFVQTLYAHYLVGAMEEHMVSIVKGACERFVRWYKRVYRFAGREEVLESVRTYLPASTLLDPESVDEVRAVLQERVRALGVRPSTRALPVLAGAHLDGHLPSRHRGWTLAQARAALCHLLAGVSC